MLPGLRFLLAAIMLSISMLVFGLGAAALLRAAHQEFVSIPSRRAPPEPVFAQRNEPPMPTLALLRENILQPSPGRYILTDVEGNRFDVRDLVALDAASQAWIMRHS